MQREQSSSMSSMSSVLEQLPVTAPRSSKASSFRSSCRRDMMGKTRFGGQVLQPSTPYLFYIAPVAIPLMSTDHDPQLLHQVHQQAYHQHQSASQAFTSSEHVGSFRGLDKSAGRMQIADSAVTAAGVGFAFMTVPDLAQQHPSWESSSRRMPADEESGGRCSLSLLSEASEEATVISIHLLFDSQAVKDLLSSCTAGPIQVSVKHSSIEILDESWLTPEEIYQGSSVIKIPRKALPDHSTLLHIYIYQQKRKVSDHHHVPSAAPGFSSFGSLPSSEAVQHNVIASMESAAPTTALRPSETMIEDAGSMILSRGGVMNQAGCEATASNTTDDSMADDVVLLSVLPVLCLPAAAAVEIQHWYISSLLLSSSAAAATAPDSAAAATAPDMPLPWGVSEGTASSSTSTSATCMLSGSRSVDSSTSCMRQMGVQQRRQYSGTSSGCVHRGGHEWQGCSTPTEFSSKIISSSGIRGKKRAPILPPGSFDSPLLPGSLLSAASLGSSSSAAVREDFEQPHQQAGSLGVEGGLKPYHHNVLQPPKIKSPIRPGSMQHHISGRQRTSSSGSSAVALSANAAAAAVTSHGHTIVDMPSIIMSLSADPASGAITTDDKTRVNTADESRSVSGAAAAAAAASWLNVQEAAGKLMFTVSEEPAAATPTVAAASTEAGSVDDESGVNAGQQHEEVNSVDPPFAFGPLIQSLSQAGRDYSHSDVILPALALMLPAAGDTPSEGGCLGSRSLNLQGEGGLGRGSSSSSSNSRNAQDDNQYIIDTTTGRDYVTDHVAKTNLLPFLSPPASSEHLQDYYNGGTAQRPAKIIRSVIRSEDLAVVPTISCPASIPAVRPSSSSSLIITDSKSTNRDDANYYKAERATVRPADGHINSKALMRAGMIHHHRLLLHQELSAAASTSGPTTTTAAASTGPTTTTDTSTAAASTGPTTTTATSTAAASTGGPIGPTTTTATSTAAASTGGPTTTTAAASTGPTTTTATSTAAASTGPTTTTAAAATGPLQGVSCAADYMAVDDNTSSHIQRLQSLVKFYYSDARGSSGGGSTSESGAMINSGFEALDEQMMMSGIFGNRVGLEQYNKHHAHVYHTVFVRFASDMDRLLTAARMTTNKGLQAADDESCHDECDELQGGHQPQVQDHGHHQQMAERQLEQQEPSLLLAGCLIQEIRGTAPKLLRSLVKGEMWACLDLVLQCIEDSKAMTLITNRLGVQLNANEVNKCCLRISRRTNSLQMQS
ncbi:hypothetical protein CEUSTIGMA_g6150.t1 [Chlamydomonas eustigma]|uniref:Uncharacterized protein n=1 Tax=Chlamydomonas eustigma TaxID=1157962 RepID=A0A250X747_9CHLO|nr:hypothetical protein CEUSTIGMA_g6150.t1 [Chlamydomonas eustigma]|eukprot:GAX78712.1 hypothetical protein CEUSTIGMA_g6150.t1 [Chlamydomonas eustigma]